MLPLTVASTRADPAAGPAPPTLGRHGDVRRDWTGNTDGRRPTGAARFHALCADLRAGSVAVAGRSRLRRDVGESGSRRQLDKDRVADAVDRALSCPPASVTVAVDDRDRGRSFTTREIGGPEGIRTPGLVSAIHALSQLSYGPTVTLARPEAEYTRAPILALRGLDLQKQTRS